MCGKHGPQTTRGPKLACFVQRMRIVQTQRRLYRQARDRAEAAGARAEELKWAEVAVGPEAGGWRSPFASRMFGIRNLKPLGREAPRLASGRPLAGQQANRPEPLRLLPGLRGGLPDLQRLLEVLVTGRSATDECLWRPLEFPATGQIYFFFHLRPRLRVGGRGLSPGSISTLRGSRFRGLPFWSVSS